jgi:hypothetical protein
MSCASDCFPALVILVLLLPPTFGQTPAVLHPHEDFAIKSLPRRILADQEHFLTSPARVKKRDLAWLVPVGAVSGILISRDQHFMNTHVRSNPDAIHTSLTVSNVSLGVLAALPAGMYVFGKVHYDSHLQEGAALATESLLDSLIAGTALKLVFARERPSSGVDSGRFFQSAWARGSFPSNHAMLSWSVASAIAHRYPGWLTQGVVYSLAAAASLARITAEEHFPSDVFVGATLGWLIGRDVFNRRHRDWYPIAAEAQAGTPPRTLVRPASPSRAEPAIYLPEREGPQPARGPILVPMDSWVYPDLERLAAFGYITDQAAGLRPWTREECLRQTEEAAESLASRLDRASSAELQEATQLIRSLRWEFAGDHASSNFVELDSVYSRYLGVSGKPLIDGYNFGQTIINDYGRPVSQGSNLVGGFSAEAVAGRFSFYVRGEYQHAGPFASEAAHLQPVANQLQPVVTGAPNGVDRFVPLEMYGGVKLGGWSLTLGKQDLWWGPGESGPLSFSNDAEPFYFFRFTREKPYQLPGVLRRLGGFRIDLIGGELAGHHVPARPLINGQKLTWNVTLSIELGFTRWSLFDGAGAHGFNLQSVVHNFLANGATFGSATDPGDRKSGFDLRWRLPGAARWITLYSDFYADDEPSPLTDFKRSAFSPGVYFARLPGLPRWDLRLEVPSTRVGEDDQGGHFLYWNNVYHDANTNQGNLLGSWVGRDGRGLWIQSSCRLGERSRLEFGYRQNRIGPAFLAGGGTQDDGSVAYSFWAKSDVLIKMSAQLERYSLPILGGRRQNAAFAIQTTYSPKWRVLHN